MMFERILTFIRNVLRVLPNDNEKRTEDNPTIHDEITFDFYNLLYLIQFCILIVF